MQVCYKSIQGATKNLGAAPNPFGRLPLLEAREPPVLVCERVCVSVLHLGALDAPSSTRRERRKAGRKQDRRTHVDRLLALLPPLQLALPRALALAPEHVVLVLVAVLPEPDSARRARRAVEEPVVLVAEVGEAASGEGRRVSCELHLGPVQREEKMEMTH